MVVLLAGVDARTSRISGANVQNQARSESVNPAAAPVPSLRSARRGADLADRREGHYAMLGVAEEQVVLVVETVIGPHLKAVGVICRASALDEIVRQVASDQVVRRCAVRLKELLHRGVDHS